jgi:hypothetical protein
MTVLPFTPPPATPAAVRQAVRAAIQSGAGRDRILAAAREAGAGLLTDKQLIPICAEEWDNLYKRRVQP